MKILFISHAASMTGAPLYLLNLCKHLKKTTDWELCFLLHHNGPLTEDFSKIGSTYVFQERPVHTASTPLTTKISNRLKQQVHIKGIRLKKLKHRLKKEHFDVVYSNTIANGVILEYLADLKIRTLTHVHELNQVIQSFGEVNLELVKLYSSHYITSSSSVTRNLVLNIGIPEEKVLETNYFPIHTRTNGVNPQEVKDALGLPKESFVVGTAGTVEWRKGWDLFIRLADILSKNKICNNIYFVWVGEGAGAVKEEVERELTLIGLTDRVIFTGGQKEPMRFFSIFDTFCLMSREEAFGIVALEAALYKIPILCFEGAEGLAGFIKDDAGFVIPGLDISEMAKAILGLIIEPEIKISKGITAYQRVIEKHSLTSQAKRIAELLKSIVQ